LDLHPLAGFLWSVTDPSFDFGIAHSYLFLK